MASSYHFCFRYLSFTAFNVLLLLMCAMQHVYAQLPAIRFEVISSKDGLPGNTVLSATRDHAGFMWFGTRQNIVRYNGATFQQYSEPETNFVTGIVADDDDNIWLSSDRNGICKIAANTLQLTCMPNTPKVDDVETTGFFYIDKHKNGWYSDRLGVNRIDLKTQQRSHYRFKPTHYVGVKATFAEDSDGNLWIIGKDNGLYKYNRVQDAMQCVWGWDKEKKTPSEPILLSGACAGENGILWIGSYNLGLIRYDTRANSMEYFKTNRRSNQINTVTPGVDENGKPILWVGDNEGLGIFRPDQNKFYFFDSILPNPYEVNFVYRDKKDEIVWVCTSEGIIKYNPASNVIRTLMIPPGLVNFPITITVVHEDDRDHNIVYMGLSHSGILQWNKQLNTFALISFPHGEAEVRWLDQQADGKLWIGTNRWDYKRPGIMVYDVDHKKFISTPLSILANQYYSVPFFMYGRFDNQGRLWIGNSDEGIHVFNSKLATDITPWTKQAQQKLLANNNLINDLVIDNKGKVWIGTMQGVYEYDSTAAQFINVDPPASHAKIQEGAVNSLLVDDEGLLWAARWGSLTKMEKNKLSLVLTRQDGYADRQTQGIAEDYEHNIWTGNYEGLYCFHHASGNLKRFTTNDGLINNNTAGHIYLSADGKALYIGQQNGFNVIDAGNLLKPVQYAVVGITSFKVHEKEKHVNLSKPVTISPDERAFSVDFIALNYRKHHDNEYAYYLEGFEKEWNYSGTNHVAYYTNLSPGSYTLHMKAGDVLGNWSPETEPIVIDVLPAFYETLWFKISLILLLASMLYGLYWYRINQFMRLQHVRNRISADLHDELGSSLSGISIMGTLAKSKLAPLHPSVSFVDRIVEEVQLISSSLDDIVWNISPRNDSLSSLIARMTRYASELFEAKQIHYTFTLPEHFDNITLSMEQRRNFYLIFKESINNLIKYSQCAHASVIISIERKKIKMLIKDDGVGFNTEAINDRNGLVNMKARAASLNGVLNIASSKDEGTTLQLDFSLS